MYNGNFWFWCHDIAVVYLPIENLKKCLWGIILKSLDATKMSLIVDDLNVSYRLYNMIRTGCYGEFYKNSTLLIQSVEEKFEHINGVKYNSIQTSDNEVVISFVTPFMMRAHTSRYSLFCWCLFIMFNDRLGTCDSLLFSIS